MKRLGLIICLIVGVILLIASDNLPRWADPQDPLHTGKTATHYITKSFEETTVPNFVTSVLADYRGYDTMFETVVVFIAGMSIMAIVGMRKGWENAESARGEVDKAPDPIVTYTCRALLPAITLFGFYVIAHGHHSPGGGFQGGVILGCALIMLALARGLGQAVRSITPARAIRLAAFGIVLYAGAGAVNVALGANFLDYSTFAQIFPVSPEAARSLSMLWVEIGVAFTVSIVMFSIYSQLSTKGELHGGL